jgi:hypothetical protein
MSVIPTVIQSEKKNAVSTHYGSNHLWLQSVGSISMLIQSGVISPRLSGLGFHDICGFKF